MLILPYSVFVCKLLSSDHRRIFAMLNKIMLSIVMIWIDFIWAEMLLYLSIIKFNVCSMQVRPNPIFSVLSLLTYLLKINIFNRD